LNHAGVLMAGRASGVSVGLGTGVTVGVVVAVDWVVGAGDGVGIAGGGAATAQPISTVHTAPSHNDFNVFIDCLSDLQMLPRMLPLKTSPVSFNPRHLSVFIPFICDNQRLSAAEFRSITAIIG
jgi:hypothetical protein